MLVLKGFCHIFVGAIRMVRLELPKRVSIPKHLFKCKLFYFAVFG